MTRDQMIELLDDLGSHGGGALIAAADARAIAAELRDANCFELPADQLGLLPLVDHGTGDGPELLTAGLWGHNHGHAVLEALKVATEPVPGRHGWRVDSAGVQWYSAAWL